MTVMSRVVEVGLSGMGMGLYKEVYSSDTLLSRRPQTQKAVRTVGAAMETGNGGRFSFTVLGLVPSRHNNMAFWDDAVLLKPCGITFPFEAALPSGLQNVRPTILQSKRRDAMSILYPVSLICRSCPSRNLCSKLPATTNARTHLIPSNRCNKVPSAPLIPPPLYPPSQTPPQCS